MPPLKKGGAYCFAPVGMSVGLLHLVQLKIQEHIAPKASNLVGR